MNDEETPFADESGSATSQRSGRSLLERIQAQRNREQQAAAAAASTPQQIQVPQYTSVPQNNNYIDGGGSPEGGYSSNFFTNAWSNMAESMELRIASMSGSTTETDLEARDALLSPATHRDQLEEYSMKNYLLTFVADMYGLFQSLPVPARWFFLFDFTLHCNQITLGRTWCVNVHDFQYPWHPVDEPLR